MNAANSRREPFCTGEPLQLKLGGYCLLLRCVGVELWDWVWVCANTSACVLVEYVVSVFVCGDGTGKGG
jgi:hypothetical protein